MKKICKLVQRPLWAMFFLAGLTACSMTPSSGPSAAQGGSVIGPFASISSGPTGSIGKAPATAMPAIVSPIPVTTTAAASPSAPSRPATSSPAPLTTDLVPPAPIPFPEAVRRAGEQLLAEAGKRLGNESRPLVIDPLIDANTGAQTVSTANMGVQLADLIKSRQPAWKVNALTREALAKEPLLMIGTLTPVTIDRSVDKQPDAFRIWLTLIDLRTKKIVAKQIDRATVDSVNPEPLPYFRDSPSWHKDKTVLGYINSCQINTQIGDAADPDYLQRLPAAAVINEATLAYGAGKVPAAHNLYVEAKQLADPGDLRVLNGLYLTSWQLGKRNEAKDAFAQLVESGLEAKKLPMKILFQPGSTAFNAIGDLPTQYQLWLDTVAERAGKVPSCVRVVGHTSRTGSANANERLSRQRAESISKLLEQKNRSLTSRLTVSGAGSKQALVGLGTDDQRDALDRRVEFLVVDCI